MERLEIHTPRNFVSGAWTQVKDKILRGNEFSGFNIKKIFNELAFMNSRDSLEVL